MVSMKIKVVIHEAEEGGYWTEVPAISGCMPQGNIFEKLLQNLHEAKGCLSMGMESLEAGDNDRSFKIAV